LVFRACNSRDRANYNELNHPDATTPCVAWRDEIAIELYTFKLKEKFNSDEGPWLADAVKNQGSEKSWLMSQPR